MAESTQTSKSIINDDGFLAGMDTTALTQASDIHVSLVDDVAIILNLDSAEYHTLNPVGQFIWKLLTPENTLSTIQSAMCTKYGVPEATAREDLFDLVTQLRRAGLVQLARR